MKQECTQWLDEGRFVFSYFMALEYWSRAEKLENLNARFAQVYKE